jgi:hypothetical protein
MTIVHLEELGNLNKNTVISMGIESVTFRFVAQCLNQLCYCSPQEYNTCYENETLM